MPEKKALPLSLKNVNRIGMIDGFHIATVGILIFTTLIARLLLRKSLSSFALNISSLILGMLVSYIFHSLILAILMAQIYGPARPVKFHPEKWKNENEVHFKHRLNMANYLIKKSRLNGLSKSEVKQLLGLDSNSFSENTWYYDLFDGRCGLGPDTELLIITFQENQVTKVSKSCT